MRIRMGEVLNPFPFERCLVWTRPRVSDSSATNPHPITPASIPRVPVQRPLTPVHVSAGASPIPDQRTPGIRASPDPVSSPAPPAPSTSSTRDGDVISVSESDSEAEPPLSRARKRARCPKVANLGSDELFMVRLHIFLRLYSPT
jgi:hypothetical protein